MKLTLQQRLKAAGVTHEEIIDHLRANLFDGSDAGVTTWRVNTLLSEVADVLAGRRDEPATMEQDDESLKVLGEIARRFVDERRGDVEEAWNMIADAYWRR